MCAAPHSKEIPLIEASASASPTSLFNLQHRDKLIHQLCDALSARFGITPNQPMVSKLQRIFNDMDLLELHRYITGLTYLPAEHPSWFGLVSKLTVHETYFFRDEPQLTMLRDKLFQYLIEQIVSETSSRLRILSAGCSTGEEAYSLAMLVLDALLEAGYAHGNENTGITLRPGWQLEVIGVDVSAGALKIAQRAHYTEEGLGSFRNLAPKWRSWFDDFGKVSLAETVTSQAYRRPKSFVRQFLHFEQHNLLQNGTHLGLFDLVICRNTMIYFNDEKKCIAQHHLFDLLKPGGILLLGATDPLLCPERCSQYRSRGMAYYIKDRS